MPSERDLLLDTNVLVQLARGKDIGKTIAGNLGITNSERQPLICRVSHGEVFALALGWKWQDGKLKRLDEILRGFVTIELNSRAVISSYASIYHHVTKELKPAKPNSENDLWIAAAAIATGCVLVTADTWFDNIAGARVSCIRVDGKTGDIVYDKALGGT